MNICEGMKVTITPASKKIRAKPGFWNWPELIHLVEKCLETGEEQQGQVVGTYYAIVKPEYRVISERLTRGYMQAHEKVRITFYHLAFTMDVEKGDTIPCPLPLNK